MVLRPDISEIVVGKLGLKRVLVLPPLLAKAKQLDLYLEMELYLKLEDLLLYLLLKQG